MLLIIFWPVERIIGTAQNPILCVIILELKIQVLTVHQLLMLFGQMSLGHGPAFALLLSVDALFEPVGDEGALAGGSFIVGVHLGRVVAEHWRKKLVLSESD
jgi:hypothetical protein